MKLSPIIPLMWMTCANWISCEPVQYCKRAKDLGSEVDFCVGVLMHQNASTQAHDMFMTLVIRRPGDASTGWTAVGLGDRMQGALMFVVYGDPKSGQQPILSIRTASGHAQPVLLTQSDMVGAIDLRVVSSAWLPDGILEQQPNPTAQMARVTVICYSCHLWPKTEVSADSKSQPWIWAWNADQEFDVFDFDTHLRMHRHHAGAGGWGLFYVNMQRSINMAKFAPSLPPIRPHVSTLGASDSPAPFSRSFLAEVIGPASIAHGVTMALAFFLLFPAGVIGIRAGWGNGFRYHWVLQTLASSLVLTGAVLGVLKRRRIDTAHQSVGVAIAALIGVQGLFGWLHHRSYMRAHRRVAVSHLHIWLGKLVMAGGWANTIAGLMLGGRALRSPLVVGGISWATVLLVVLNGYSWWRQRAGAGAGTGAGAEDGSARRRHPRWVSEGQAVFALSESDDEDDIDEMDSDRGQTRAFLAMK